MLRFLQAVGVGSVGDNGVEGVEHNLHPGVVPEAHHGGVELEHLGEGGGHPGVAHRVALVTGT